MNDQEQPVVVDSLKRVRALAALMVAQAAAVADLEAKLAEANKVLRRTSTEDLPDLMIEVQLASVTLEDGSMVELNDTFHCGISEDRKPKAHQWLIDNDFGGLIKTNVVVAFGRGDRALADKLVAKIASLKPFADHPALKTESVHAATLKSFIKEQREKGKSPPEELFGIQPYTIAVLKESKKVKEKAAKKAKAT